MANDCICCTGDWDPQQSQECEFLNSTISFMLREVGEVSMNKSVRSTYPRFRHEPRSCLYCTETSSCELLSGQLRHSSGGKELTSRWRALGSAPCGFLGGLSDTRVFPLQLSSVSPCYSPLHHLSPPPEIHDNSQQAAHYQILTVAGERTSLLDLRF